MKLTTFKDSGTIVISTRLLGDEGKKIVVTTLGGLRMVVERHEVERDTDSHSPVPMHGRAAKMLAKRKGWLGTWHGGQNGSDSCVFVCATDSVGITK